MKRIHLNIFVFLLLLTCRSTAIAGEGGNSWSSDWDGGSKAFIENKGQFYTHAPEGFSGRVLYAYDGSSTRIFFTNTGVTFSFVQKSKKENTEHDRNEKFRNANDYLEKEKEEKAADVKSDMVSYRWEGANPNAEVIAEDPAADYFSYSFYSMGAEKNENFIKGYKKLIYKNLYPNIDVEYTFHPESGIKYALVLHPGASISDVKMVYSDKFSLQENGNILIPTSFGDITDHAPITFYEENNSSLISSRFSKKGKSITFELENYDDTKTVIVDPWTQTPALPNSNKIWETETDNSGNVYIYGGDTFIKLLKYNAAGTLQWTYISPWDSANFWIGGFITDPSGNSYMTSGSNGQIRKITPAGAVAWFNNPNGLTTYEYWSLAFNCDMTHLVVGGTRAAFGFPVVILGVIMEINLGTGAQVSTRVVAYGSTSSIPPNVQEVSSICMAPNGNYYFLTLDTVGSINTALTNINFKAQTGYNFDYYIPGYGFGTKQPISAIRASSAAFYTLNGATIHKRSLTTGAVLATAAIPGGISTTGFFGTKLNGNGGLDIDSCGNVYVGSGNAVIKYDANLNLITSAPTTFAVYDVDVNSNGEVAACGWSGGVGKVQTFNMSACRQIAYVCVTSLLSVTSASTNILCNGQCTGTGTATPSGGTAPYTYSWTPSGGTNATASALCAGTYTCTVTDNVGATATTTVTITQPPAITSSSSQTNVSCNGGCTGTATVTAGGGTAPYTYSWNTTPSQSAATATGLCAGSYTVTVRDANNCTRTQLVTITQPSAITSSATPTNVSCNGGTNGSAVVTASGGTGPYSYSWNTTPAQTTATATGLSAGTYTCTITDANGCTRTQTVTITQPSLISASTSSTPASCGNFNGSATVTASGGTGSLTYSWAPTGGTNTTATGLGAGSYTVTVTDANGCTRTATAIVSSSNGPTVTVQSQTNVMCNGAATGSATVNVTGGTAPYTYSWTPSGGTTATATGLGAGTYTCTVTDNSGCTQVQTITITQPPAINASTSTTQTGCNVNSGTATVTASGGTGTLTYSWAPTGGTNTTATGLGAGSYTVTVTDANGCTRTATAIVSSSNAPTVTVQSQTNVLCNGASTGSATVNVTGGVSPYTYSWSPGGGTNASASGLGAGTYTITVTGANGCTAIQTVTITQPPVITASASTTQTGCNSSTGTATVTASGGTGTLTYSWTPTGGTGTTATGLGAGTYTVTVTDANGCTRTATAMVTVGNAPTSSVLAQTNVSCNGGNNGSASINVTGGTGPYTYSWSPSGGTTSSASGLSSGTYTVTVTDANGCTATSTIIISQPIAITASAASVPACGLNNGSATATVSGGTLPYTYSWSPSGGTGASATGLSAGSYTCLITDANGCTRSVTVNVITNPVPAASAGANVTISLGNSATLNATGGGTYSWNNGATASSITVAPTSTTTYCVYVTSSAGCTNSACVIVTVDVTCGALFVPNAFSPNNDNQNDVLKIYGGCIKELKFSIYDRWGEKVFETTNPADAWDGTYKGQMMNTAVFVYRLEAVLTTGESISKKGNISLVR